MKDTDIPRQQDFYMAVTHLISIEEHLAFTYMKTKKRDYLDILHEVRKLRTAMMKKLLRTTEGELWCISKHLMSAFMRFVETANKYEDESAEYMAAAFDVYSLFWFLQADGYDSGKPEKARKSAR